MTNKQLIATSEISNKDNLVDIASLAGCSDFNNIQYDDGVLTIIGIEQSALDDAIANFTPPSPLVTYIPMSIAIINDVAEQARLRFLTAGFGQSLIYKEKGEEAIDYATANYPKDLKTYPFINAEVLATGKTSKEVADNIIAKRSSWITVGSAIEQLRMSAITQIIKCTTTAEIDTLVHDTTETLNLLTPE